MFCPRCGTENADSDRFCRSCGADLQDKPSQGDGKQGDGKPWRTRLRDVAARLIGRSRRERIISGATALAIIVAVVSLLALKPKDEESKPAANPAADAACVKAKREFANAATRGARAPHGGLGIYAAGVVRALVEFRTEVGKLVPPAEAAELEAALRDASVEASGLGRLSGAESRSAIPEQANRLGTAMSRVDGAIENLGLDICASLRPVPAPTAAG